MSGRRARAQRIVGHSHEQIIHTLGRVSDVCRQRFEWTTARLHAEVATDIPRTVRRREAARSKEPLNRQLRKEYRRSRRRGRNQKSIPAAMLAAPGRVVMRRVTAPLRAAETMVWTVLWAVLLAWAGWYYLAPQQLKDFGAWVIPGSCAAPAEPPTITRGAVWAAHDLGDGLRSASQLDVDPQAIRAGYRAGAISLGQLYGSLKLGIEGKPAPVNKTPMAERREGLSAVSAAGCAPCPSGGVTRQASTTPTTGTLTDRAVADLALSVGWPAAEVTSGRLGAYVLAESGNDPSERDYLDGTHQGLLQLGTAEQRAYLEPGGDVFDPEDNLRAALKLWQARGWQPWTASATAHVQYLPRAQAASAGTTTVAQPVCATGTATATSAGLEGLTNGEIPRDRLCSFSWAPSHLGRCDAVLAAEGLNAAYRAEFGSDIAITDSYRDRAGQDSCWARKGRMCAVPGTSNHGWGIALDLGGGIQRFGTREHRWMQQVGPAFGWVNPGWAQRGGTKPEPWHHEYVGAEGTAAG